MKYIPTVAGMFIIAYFVSRYLMIEHPIWSSIILMTSTAGGLAIICFDFPRRKPAQQQPAPEPEPAHAPTKVYEITCGDFFNAMREVAKGFPNANKFFADWHENNPKSFWDEFYKARFDVDFLEQFVEQMTQYFRDATWNATGKLNEDLTKEGHAFLRAISVKCTTLNIDASGIDFNPLLSFGEAVMRAQS